MRSIRLRRRPDDGPSLLTEQPALARRLRWATHPRFYAAQVDAPEVADDVDAAIEHFLAHGAEAGARISGLFNPDVYAQRLAERRLSVDPDEPPFLHWLTVGWEERIVPTVLFDESFYVGRHPDLGGGPDWVFAQYLRAGCYAPARTPTPFAPNYGGVPAPDARERQDPPLVTGLLHLAERYDLTRTSWLEEGVTLGAAKLAALGSDRMRALVAKAAAIEPLVAQTPRERWVSWPPHTHPMVMPTARAEEVRRRLGLTRADTVLVMPGGTSAGDGVRAVAAALREREPDATVLVATTEAPATETLDDRAVALDLGEPWADCPPHRRLLGLLDVVRGVRPRRVVVAGSELGWRLLSTYGTTLRHETELAVVMGGAAPYEDFQGCFDRVAWAVTDTDAVRDDLVGRYLLPTAARARLLSAAECAAGALGPLLGEGPGHA